MSSGFVKKELSADAEFLQSVIHFLPVSTILRIGDLLLMNKYVEELIGYSNKEISNVHDWFGMLYGKHSGLIKERYLKLRKGDFQEINTFAITCKDSSKKYIEFNGFKNDEIEIWILIDRTELFTKEKILRESEAKYRFLSENTGDVIWLIDYKEKNFKYVSPSVFKLRGYTAEEVMEQGLDEVMTPESMKFIVSHLFKRIEAFNNGSEEYRFQTLYLDQKCKDGSVVNTEVATTLITDADGKVIEILGVTRDNTDKKKIDDHRNHLLSISQLVSETSALLSCTNSIEELYELLEKKISVLANNNYILITGLDEETNTIGIERYAGFQPYIDLLLKIMKVDVRKSRFKTSDMTPEELILFSSKSIVDYQDGIYGLSTKILPKQVSLMVERILGIKKIYTIGFAINGNLYGGLTILAKQELPFENLKAIETLVNLSTVLIHRKRAEQKISASEKKFKTIFKDANDALFLLKNDVFIDCNTKAEQLFKCSRNDLLGKTPWDFSPEKQPDGRNSKEKATEKVNDCINGKSKLFEWYHKDINDEELITEISLSLISTGNESLLLAIVHDKTDEYKQKIQQKIFKERLELAMEATDDAVWDMTIDGDTYFSKRFYSMLGYDEADFPASQVSFIKLLHPLESKKVINFFQNFNANENTHFQIELRLRAKNGTYKWILSRGKVIEKTDEGKIHRIVGTNTDYTYQKKIENEMKNKNEELKKAIEIAKESDRFKSDFVYNISHELRSPLNTIMGFANIMENSEVTKEEQIQYSQFIIDSTHDLFEQINNILDMSTIEANLVTINNNEFVINELMDEIEESFVKYKNQKQKEQIELVNKKFFHDEHIIMIKTDEAKLKKVFMILLNNAFKFTQGGRIEFGYNVVNGVSFQFYVSDTGIGVSPEKQTIIFERFRQADEGIARHYGGAGLGLAIAKTYIEKMGGNIRLESIPKKGSTFYFDIPVIPIEREQKMSSENIINTINIWENKKILIVEDELVNFLLFQRVLKRTGAAIIHASSGNEAIAKYFEIPDIDLILMDIRLPDINGLEVTRVIRKNSPDIRIIAQTAYAMEEDKTKCIEAGCNDYISKPINIKKLLEKINEQLS